MELTTFVVFTGCPWILSCSFLHSRGWNGKVGFYMFVSIFSEILPVKLYNFIVWWLPVFTKLSHNYNYIIIIVSIPSNKNLLGVHVDIKVVGLLLTHRFWIEIAQNGKTCWSNTAAERLVCKHSKCSNTLLFQQQQQKLYFSVK